MFKFSAPPLNHRLKISRTTKAEFEKDFANTLESFPIHSVNLLIPNSGAFKEKYENSLISDDSIYFIVQSVPASYLVQRTCLESFVRSGLFLAVTNEAKIENDNFLCITPSGKLILSLEKSIAECLALQKEKNQNKKRKRHFETIIIDLMCPEISPGKKLHKSISFELSKIDHIKFNLLLKWKPTGNICPQSLKSYFISEGFECIACKPKYKSSSNFSVPAPNISFDKSDSDILHDVLEWIGMQICGLEYAVEEDEYVNKLTLPDYFETVSRLHKCSFEGFYAKSEVLSVIQELSKVFENNKHLPYIIACISGFQDAYVQANGFQFFSSDDKLIYIIIFPSFNYWLITLNCR